MIRKANNQWKRSLRPRISAFVKFFLLMLLLSCSGCSILDMSFIGITESEQPTLSRSAAHHNRKIGVAVAHTPLVSDSRYREIVVREFSSITPENAMKFAVLQPRAGEYNFTNADAIVNFAVQHDLTVRGHPLVWHRRIPRWLTETTLTSDEASKALGEFIQKVVSRYRESVRTWDVVNEAIGANGKLRYSYWKETIGDGYIADAFHRAHQANPSAKLFYNDYDLVVNNAKFQGVYELLRSLREAGTPVHGVGLQLHIRPTTVPSKQRLRYVLQQFAALGLEIHITELDVALSAPVTEEKLQWQADLFRTIAKSCLEEPACTSLSIWGLSDNHSWIPTHFPDLQAATLFDENFRKKPAYWALIGLLKFP